MVKENSKLFILLFVVTLFLFLTGCSSLSTNSVYFSGTKEHVQRGDFSAAVTATEQAKDTVYNYKDRVMYFLDLGMLLHYKGEYERSNLMLEKAERAIEELFTKSISKAMVSLLLNDNSLDYSGEDYEDIYINIFKALNYINLGNSEAAFVEVRRVNEKLNLLETKYGKLAQNYNNSKDAKIKLEAGSSRFYNSALARYLSLLLYRSEGRWDDARIDAEGVKSAFSSQPEIYDFSSPDLSGSLQKSSTGHLSVICFGGVSPDKRSKTWWIRTWNDHIFIGASRESLSGEKVTSYADMFYWKGITDNLFFKFEIPVMRKRSSRISKIEVKIDGETYKPFQIEDIDNVALATFAVKKPLIYIKTILRTVGKGILAKQGKDKLEAQVNDELLSSILNFGADLVVAATEQADLRVSHYFPKRAHILDLPVEPGKHSVEISYYDNYGNLIYNDNKGFIDIKSSGLNVLESFYLQ